MHAGGPSAPGCGRCERRSTAGRVSGVDRLRDVAVAAGGQRLLLVALHGVGRQGEDQDPARRRVGLEAAGSAPARPCPEAGCPSGSGGAGRLPAPPAPLRHPSPCAPRSPPPASRTRASFRFAGLSSTIRIGSPAMPLPRDPVPGPALQAVGAAQAAPGTGVPVRRSSTAEKSPPFPGLLRTATWIRPTPGRPAPPTGSTHHAALAGRAALLARRLSKSPAVPLGAGASRTWARSSSISAPVAAPPFDDDGLRGRRSRARSAAVRSLPVHTITGCPGRRASPGARQELEPVHAGHEEVEDRPPPGARAPPPAGRPRRSRLQMAR